MMATTVACMFLFAALPAAAQGTVAIEVVNPFSITSNVVTAFLAGGAAQRHLPNFPQPPSGDMTSAEIVSFTRTAVDLLFKRGCRP
jgi:hypothetical protein